jgi:hypothetical protein
MMTRKLGWMFLGVTSLACSGHYEVGGMDATAGVGGNRGAAGGAAPGGASTNTAGVPVVDPNGEAGSSTMPIAPDCLTASEPGPLTGPFAAPEVVWQRAARLTWGAAAPPPSGLPTTTTYEWASALAITEVVGAHTTIGDAPGVDDLLRQWLGLDADASFVVRWGQLLPVPKPALNTLLFTSVAPYRTGVFTEQSWLAKNATISARGAGIQRSLLGTEVPAPPTSLVNPPPDPTLTDRRALETQTAAAPCAACHSILDPPGYALGHFAADGSYRALDHGEPIDTTGTQYVAGEMVEFNGIEDFSQKVANTCQATLGFSDALLRAALVINESPQDQRESLFQASQSRVQQGFIAGGRTYNAWVTAYLQSPAGLRP